MSGNKSGNSISLHNSMDKENLFLVFKEIINNVAYTYMGANNATSLTDHFIVSEGVTMLVGDYFTLNSVVLLVRIGQYTPGFLSHSRHVFWVTVKVNCV